MSRVHLVVLISGVTMLACWLVASPPAPRDGAAASRVSGVLQGEGPLLRSTGRREQAKTLPQTPSVQPTTDATLPEHPDLVHVEVRVVGADGLDVSGVEIECRSIEADEFRVRQAVEGTISLPAGRYEFGASGLEECGKAIVDVAGSEQQRVVTLQLRGITRIRGRLAYDSEERVPWGGLYVFAYAPRLADRMDAFRRYTALREAGRITEALEALEGSNSDVCPDELGSFRTQIEPDGRFALAVPESWTHVGLSAGVLMGSCFGGCPDLEHEIAWRVVRDLPSMEDVELTVEPGVWGGVRIRPPEELRERGASIHLAAMECDACDVLKSRDPRVHTWYRYGDGEWVLFPVPVGLWKGSFTRYLEQEVCVLGTFRDVKVEGRAWPVVRVPTGGE